MTLLADQVAIVTGASSGIGWAVAARFWAEGAAVVVNHELAHDRALREQLRAAAPDPERVLCVAGDVSSPRDVANIVCAAHERFGRIDIVVNNAGIAPTAEVVSMDDAVWDRVLDVNLKSQYLMTKAVAKHMCARRYGRIVNIASELALVGAPGLVAYCASKAGVIGLTRAAALELAPYDITVNCVAPGPTDTRMLENWERTPETLATIPMGRFGNPAEIAWAVLHFAVRQAGWTTGQTLSPNGGTVTS